jgi:hypothetical protein
MHLFEFMDQDWVRGGLRTTLREILECGNGPPFRNYYPWVAEEVQRIAAEERLTNLVEVGAGTAPITRTLARRRLPPDVHLTPSDINPDGPTLEELARQHPQCAPIYEPVDFAIPRDWPVRTLLYLSATFHHIPPEQRMSVLKTLKKSADRVVIFEPLRNTVPSMLFVFLSIVPALLIPLWYIRRPGVIRRFVWCWLIPIAPVMFWWDGLVSCLRMWSEREWRERFAAEWPEAAVSDPVKKTLFCQLVLVPKTK